MKFRRFNSTWLPHCQVYCDDVTEPLLVVEDGGEVGDEHDEGGGDVDGHDGANDLTFELDHDTDPHHPVIEGLVGDCRPREHVLLGLPLSQPRDGVPVNQLEEVVVRDGDVDVAGLLVKRVPRQGTREVFSVTGLCHQNRW